MLELRLLPNSSLKARASEDVEFEDVSERANEHLFDLVEIDPAVTLANVFGLLRRCPTLCGVFRRNFAYELVDEADKGSLPEFDSLEYLELYEGWQLNTGINEYEPMRGLDLRGLGSVLDADSLDGCAMAGERIQWNVSMTPLRSMLTLPVRVSNEIEVWETDPDAKACHSKVQTVKRVGVSLGQVLHGLLNGLSFYGAQASQEEFLELLKEQSASMGAGVTGEELIAELGGYAHLGYDAFFDALGGCRLPAVNGAVRNLDDDENVVDGLEARLGDGVVVKTKYREFQGRAFRRVLRLAEAENRKASRVGGPEGQGDRG